MKLKYFVVVMTGNESVLLVRLHLLQAILHHLQNRKDAAIKMFEQVESEIQKLKVDEGKALDLMTTLSKRRALFDRR